MKDLETLKSQVTLLEQKALIFSEIDRVRYEEIMSEIKSLDAKILDLMVLEAEMDRFEAFID